LAKGLFSERVVRRKVCPAKDLFSERWFVREIGECCHKQAVCVYTKRMADQGGFQMKNNCNRYLLFLFIFLCLAVLLYACGPHEAAQPLASEQAEVDEDAAAQHTAGDGAATPAGSRETFFAPCLDAAGCLDIQELPISSLKPYSLHGFYDDAYMLAYRWDEQERGLLGFGLFSLANASYEEWFTNEDPNFTFGVFNFDQRFVFFEQTGDNWRSRDIRLLDRESGNLTFVLQDALCDPFWDTGTVLAEGLFYFDNLLLSAQGEEEPALYAYDTETGSLELLRRQCQNPLAYQREILCAFPDQDGKYTRLEAIDGSYSRKIDFRPVDIAATPAGLFVIASGEEPAAEERMPPPRQIREISSETPFYRAEAMLSNLTASESFLAWQYYDAGRHTQPLLYDLKNRTLLCFEGPAYLGEYYFFLQGDYGLLQVVRSYEEDDYGLYYFSQKPGYHGSGLLTGPDVPPQSR